MDKLIFYYDYGSFPFRIEREDGSIEHEYPPEILGNIELLDKLFEIEKEYKSLFINTSYCFSYIGFKNLEEKYHFIRQSYNIFMEIQKLLEGKYEVVEDFSDSFKEKRCTDGKSNRPNWK